MIKTFKLILLLTLALTLAVVVLQNQDSIQVRFLWLTGEMPQFILLFLTAVAGFIIGLIAGFLVKRDVKSKQ